MWPNRGIHFMRKPSLLRHAHIQTSQGELVLNSACCLSVCVLRKGVAKTEVTMYLKVSEPHSCFSIETIMKINISLANLESVCVYACACVCMCTCMYKHRQEVKMISDIREIHIIHFFFKKWFFWWGWRAGEYPS